MERLTERDDYGDVYVKQHDYITASKKLCEYEELEEQGLLLRLPCKVGDEIYILDRSGQPQKMILDEPAIRCHCAEEDDLCMALCSNKTNGVCAYRLKNDGSDIGKTVFLTREEAERALREEEE